MDQMCGHSGQSLANSFIAVILHFASFFLFPKSWGTMLLQVYNIISPELENKMGDRNFFFQFLLLDEIFITNKMGLYY